MSEYFDIVAFRKTKNDKTYARQIGSAKKRDDGGFNLYFDALPVDGQCSIVPQRKREVGGKDAPF